MAENDKQTEEKIFEAATEVLVEKGMDGTRMQHIADRAGINKSLLHYYYRTKDRLFEAVFEKITDQILRKFAPILDENLSLEAKIRFFYREHIEFLKKNPRLPAFFLNEINRNPERIRKLLRNIDIENLWDTLENQHRDELRKHSIDSGDLPQLMISIASLSVFPFVARGVFEAVLEKTGNSFDDYMEKRKEFLAEFVIRAIRNARNA